LIIRILKAFVPVLLIVAGAYGAWKLIQSRPEVETAPIEKVFPNVRTIQVKPQSLRLSVHSQGTVTARTVTELIPEISGKVLYVSPSLVAGGFFQEGEVLLRIDPHDYRLALTRSQAEVAQAELSLEQERAEAEVAAQEWAELGSGEQASPLVLRKPQVAQAEASLEAARATMQQARRDLEKTEIAAPFNGRVRQENVDVGQYVSRGAALARLYSVDIAEVRLPLPNEDLAYIDIPLSYRYDDPVERTGPDVLLKAQWAGREYTWRGRIVRTEGEIDPSTRMLYAVAQVNDPYAHGDDPDRPPLAVGMFVEAEIRGNRIDRAVTLPRAAIRGSDTIYIVDEESRLRFRRVTIYKRERDRVIIQSGLAEGEEICISPLESAVDGMEVRVTRQETES
jgi:RND family efflux transporter MFP subunit